MARNPPRTYASKGRDELAPGDVLGGKYRLEERLGEGGMGVLWMAHNEALDIEVALKVIRAELAGKRNADGVGRLLHEARAAARIGHPAIVRITDFGKTPAGDPYLVMELLEGEDLASALDRRGRLNPLNAVRIILPIAHALAAAHDKGIVHRDLKPENVYLVRTEEGLIQPKLIDFGVAKLTNTETAERITAVGVVVGSPGYMAPEQARGDECDERADVWSLAVVLYEMVTGALPFEGANYNALMRAIIEDQATPITVHGAGDDALWSILRRGLEKAPAARWASMRAMGQALSGWLMERGVQEDVCGSSLEAMWHRTHTPLDLDSVPPPSTSSPGSRRGELSSTPPPSSVSTLHESGRRPIRVEVRPSSDPPPSSREQPAEPTRTVTSESPVTPATTETPVTPAAGETSAPAATPRSWWLLVLGALVLVVVTATLTWLVVSRRPPPAALPDTKEQGP